MMDTWKIRAEESDLDDANCAWYAQMEDAHGNVKRDVTGFGPTRSAAVADLKKQLAEVA